MLTEPGALTRKLRADGKAFAGSRLLVAEDNESIRFVIKELLELSGFTVETVNNGKDVISLLEKRQFDAVLLDIHMPEMDGIKVTEYIRKHLHLTDLPIIAITGDVTGWECENWFASGINDYVLKPFTAATLLASLARWLKPND